MHVGFWTYVSLRLLKNCLLGFEILNSYYKDECLPMGCSISCSLFEKFSTFLHGEVQHRSNIQSIVHYLDNFFICRK